MSIVFLVWCAVAMAAVLILTLLRLHCRKAVIQSVILVLGMLMITLLLSGCGDTAEPAAEAESTPAPVYQVRYFFREDLLQTQQLTEGQTPAHLELTLPGLSFVGWKQSDGAIVQPEHHAAIQDCDYYAVTYPVLENHVPFLFPDEEGFLHPDAPMTYQDLSEALQALAAPAAKAYLPQLPESGESLQHDDFRDVLLQLFHEKDVDNATLNALPTHAAY